MTRTAGVASGFSKGARHGAVLAGIGYTVAAVACFAVSDTTAKYVTGFVPLMVALWFRYAIQAFITTLLILPKHGVAALKTAHPKFQILRGVLLAMTSLLAFLSLRYMPVGEFTAIVMIGICGVASGWLTLHEGRKTHVDIQPPES